MHVIGIQALQIPDRSRFLTLSVRAMKRTAAVITLCAILGALIFSWSASEKTLEDFYGSIEEKLNEALQRLRQASVTDRRADPFLASGVMTLAAALAEGGDTRQKRLAAAAKKEVGLLLFADESAAKAPADGFASPAGQISSASELSETVEPYPGPLPKQLFTPLPLQSYVGTYAGTIAGRQVNFVVTITTRNLLGIRITGLDVQPTLEFAEIQPQEFIRPDARTHVVFTDRTKEGFRTLVFQQNGVRERAENLLFSTQAESNPPR